MDDRRAQLIVAAQALCAWVRAQQAARDAVPAPGSMPLHVSSFTPSFTPAYAPAAAAPLMPPPVPAFDDRVAVDADADVATGTADPIFGAEPVPVVARPSFDLAGRVAALTRALAGAMSTAAPLVRRGWKPALASIAVVALVGAARFSWTQWGGALQTQLRSAGEHVSVFDRPSSSAPPPTVVPANADAVPKGRTGRLLAESTPVGAHVIVDGRDRGVTPLTLTDLAVGVHTVVLRGDAGSIQRAITIAADKTTQLNEAIFSGWVHVSSPIELQVSAGGRGLRLDDGNQVLLAPGPHELTFANRRFGFSTTRRVDVRPGDTTSVTIEPPASKLSVSASTAAEVLIDGMSIGATPLIDVDIALGTREIVVRSEGGAEKRQTVTVTVEPLILNIDFPN